MTKGFRKRKQKIFDDIQIVLAKDPNPMTIRQVYYQLVAWFKYKPIVATYNDVLSVLIDARKKYGLDCDKIIDAGRSLVQWSAWNDVADFIDTVKHSYNKDKWTDQKEYLQVWIEKDALAGVIEPICKKYNVPLLSGKGAFSISCINEAQKTFPVAKRVRILYFGDLDPAGVIKIERGAVVNNLNEIFKQYPIVERMSLTLDEVEKYKLPKGKCKRSSNTKCGYADTSAPEYIKEFSDIVVELDALPPKVLRQKVEQAILKYLDVEQFNKDLKAEQKDVEELNKIITKGAK